MSTDSMLLGALAYQADAMNILDIGCGTGVLALMMAQKHPEAMVDAVEIDWDSAEEANKNFEHSPFSYRLTCYHQSVQDFAADDTLHYDLIVCNPPYFEAINPNKGNNLEWPAENRLDARTQSSLSYSALFEIVQRLMVQYGSFYMVAPFEHYAQLVSIAKEQNLYLVKKFPIAHHVDSFPNRIVLCFKKEPESWVEEDIFLFEPDGTRSADYKKLTEAFHLDNSF